MRNACIWKLKNKKVKEDNHENLKIKMKNTTNKNRCLNKKLNYIIRG